MTRIPIRQRPSVVSWVFPMTQGFKEQSVRSLKRQTYTWGHRIRNREGGERGGTGPRFCSSFCLQKFPPGRLWLLLNLQGWGPTTSPGTLPSKPVHLSLLTWRYSWCLPAPNFLVYLCIICISAFTHELHKKPVASVHRWIPTPRKVQWVFVDWMIEVNETSPKQRPILRLWQFSNPQVIIKWHRNHSGWFMDVRVILFG